MFDEEESPELDELVSAEPPLLLTAAGGVADTDCGCVLNDSSMTSAATVLTIASKARFMRTSSLGPGLAQNSKLSRWMCRRGTFAVRNALTTAVVIPAGPHTYASCLGRSGMFLVSAAADSGS